jgi:hypothetical protein
MAASSSGNRVSGLDRAATRSMLEYVFHKVVQIVVQSRVVLPQETPREVDSFLHLITDDIISLKQQVPMLPSDERLPIWF